MIAKGHIRKRMDRIYFQNFIPHQNWLLSYACAFKEETDHTVHPFLKKPDSKRSRKLKMTLKCQWRDRVCWGLLAPHFALGSLIVRIRPPRFQTLNLSHAYWGELKLVCTPLRGHFPDHQEGISLDKYTYPFRRVPTVRHSLLHMQCYSGWKFKFQNVCVAFC